MPILFRRALGRVAIVIGASILMSSQVFARDVTFSCSDPPDRSARVAIAEGATVNKTQDRNEKRCSFSVNGAKADSPGAEALLEGVNSFRQGAPIVGELGKKSVDNLAYAMLATAPVSEIPKEFADFLQRNSGALADCVQGFFKGSDPNITLTSTFGNSGYCRRYEAPQYLEITITWSNGRFVSSLYVHRMAPNLPRIKR